MNNISQKNKSDVAESIKKTLVILEEMFSSASNNSLIDKRHIKDGVGMAKLNIQEPSPSLKKDKS